MFKLPDLPYPYDSLEPVVSAQTMKFHHDKHHAKYVETTNKLLESAAETPTDLESLVRRSGQAPEKVKLYDNAAQAWNHAFFWNCLKPGGGGKPGGELARKIESDLGGMDKFVTDFKAAAVGRFGSGWAWLVLDHGKLKISTTPNAETPIAKEGLVPIFTVDVWEHAYYLDYQNKRPDFVAAMLASVANWDFAEHNLEQAAATAS